MAARIQALIAKIKALLALAGTIDPAALLAELKKMLPALELLAGFVPQLAPLLAIVEALVNHATSPAKLHTLALCCASSHDLIAAAEVGDHLAAHEAGQDLAAIAGWNPQNIVDLVNAALALFAILKRFFPAPVTPTAAPVNPTTSPSAV